MSRRRLLWLTQGSSDKLPSLRLRVLEVAPFLDDVFEQSFTPAPSTVLDAWSMRKNLHEADVVVLQKELVTQPVLLILRFYVKRLVYDLDDAVYVRLKADGGSRKSYKRSHRFAAICRSADLVIAGNPFLEAAAITRGARRVAVLPTGVRVPEFMSENRQFAKPVRVGWIGTNVNLPYIEALEPTFLRLEQEGFSYVLCIMAGHSPRFNRFSAIEFTCWSPEAEENFLRNIQIGLMPLNDNEHTRGKCAYKALQYMSFGVPVVVSDVGITAEWTRGAGFSAKTSEQFGNSLRALMSDEQLRSELGRCGRKRIQREFAISIVASSLRRILLALF